MKPKFLLDGDDVILRTGDKKVEYLRQHLKNADLLVKDQTVVSIRPEECSRTLLVPIIGENSYDEMTSYVYSLEGTIDILPVPGALEGVQRLSKMGEVYLISARKPEHTANTAEWCRKNQISQYLTNISSTKDSRYDNVQKLAGSKKVGIAVYFNAQMFVDDDPRHMPTEKVEGLDCLLFGEANRSGSPEHIIIAKSWKEIVSHAENLEM